MFASALNCDHFMIYLKSLISIIYEHLSLWFYATDQQQGWCSFVTRTRYKRRANCFVLYSFSLYYKNLNFVNWNLWNKKNVRIDQLLTTNTAIYHNDFRRNDSRIRDLFYFSIDFPNAERFCHCFTRNDRTRRFSFYLTIRRHDTRRRDW